MPINEGDALGETQLVVFRLGDEEFGTDIAQVREIIKLVDITKMPGSPEFVEGVINLRDTVITIIDLRKKLGIISDGVGDDARIIVIELEDSTLGMVVDSVTEVLRLSARYLDGAPTLASRVETEYIRGVGKLDDRILILLDLRRVLTGQEVAQVEQVRAEAVL
jgi:purine-binding chemotaxis protein CheW